MSHLRIISRLTDFMGGAYLAGILGRPSLWPLRVWNGALALGQCKNKTDEQTYIAPKFLGGYFERKVLPTVAA